MQNPSSKDFDDARAFRAFFAIRWSEFLRRNYRSPEHVAVVYGVTYQTARNWWDGLNRPTGDVVALAWLRHPDALADAMRRDVS